MAIGSTTTFGQYKLFLGNNASPEVFVLVCGLTSRSVSISKSLGDTAVPDCDDPDLPSWVVRDVESISMNIDGSGLATRQSMKLLQDWALSPGSRNLKVEQVGTANEGGGVYAGKFHMSDFEVGAQKGQRNEVSFKMASDGVVTFTPTA